VSSKPNAALSVGYMKTLDLGVLGGNIEGALKTVDLEKILSHIYLGRTFFKIYTEFLHEDSLCMTNTGEDLQT
jgi:hypothetical protein